jgi:hypothetical protein
MEYQVLQIIEAQIKKIGIVDLLSFSYFFSIEDRCDHQNYLKGLTHWPISPQSNIKEYHL